MKTNLLQLSSLAMCLFCVVITHGSLLAGDENFSKRKSRNEIVAGTSIEVEDDKYSTMATDPTWPRQFTNHKIYNLVTLGIDRYSDVFQPVSYQVTVSVRVTHYKYNTVTAAFEPVTVTKDLVVNYDLNAPYNDKTLFRFVGGNRMEVEILSVTADHSSAVMNLFLEAAIYIERYYPLTDTPD